MTSSTCICPAPDNPTTGNAKMAAHPRQHRHSTSLHSIREGDGYDNQQHRMEANSSSNLSPESSPTEADPDDLFAGTSSSEAEEQETANGFKGLREVEAESIIAPVISRTQSSALFAAAASSAAPAPAAERPSGEGSRGRSELCNATHKRPPRNQEVLRYTSGGAARSSFPPQQQQQQQSKKLIPFNLPNIQLPNVSLPSLSSFGQSLKDDKPAAQKTKRRSKTLFLVRPTSIAGGSFFPNRSSAVSRRPQTSVVPADDLARPELRRRASSVSSLQRVSLTRTISTTSSLGDDAKFIHVHSQSNSRFKAIKDNFLDGLPTLPTLPALSQFNPFAECPPSPSTAQFTGARSPGLEALDTVTGDVVILGGYRGSILRDKTSNNRRVWIPLKVGFNLRKVDLEVGLEPEDDEKMAEKIVADGMLSHIGPVDISRRLIRRLRTGASEHGRRVHDWGYDWRLSPALLSKRLIEFLETLPCNKPLAHQLKDANGRPIRGKKQGALVIAHSLGGLITRHAVNQRPELFSGVIYAGTPMNCVNILGPLRNGDSVLLNSKVFTAQVNFTLRTSFVFLPEDGECFVDRRTGKTLPIDFWDVEKWKEYKLSPCVVDPLPTTGLGLGSLALKAASSWDLLKDKKVPANSTSNTSDEFLRSLPPHMSSISSLESPTLPLSKTIPYLKWVLDETKKFKKALHFRPELAELYPPLAVVYSKTTPTVRGARVDGYEGIKRADVYDDLIFGAGDGVCLARAAQLPPGYRVTKRVAVDRGHVSLLGDLEGVGECVRACVAGRGW